MQGASYLLTLTTYLLHIYLDAELVRIGDQVAARVAEPLPALVRLGLGLGLG